MQIATLIRPHYSVGKMWYRTTRIVDTYGNADVTQNLSDTVNDDASIVNTALTAIMKDVIRVRDI
jgi:hypothetical protein